MPFGGEGGPWMLKSVSCVWLSVSLWTVACQVPLSMGFSRQEYWSGLPFFFSRGFSPPRDRTCTSCVFLCCRQILHLLSHQGSPQGGSVQSLSRVRLFETPQTAARQASWSITNSRSLPKLMSIELVMPSNHLILCHPFSFSLQSFPASGPFQMSQLFKSGGAKVLEFQLQHQPFQWTLRVDIL